MNRRNGKYLKKSDASVNLYIVNAAELQELDVRPRLFDYVKQIWNRRDYIVEDSKAKAFRTQRNYRLWKIWLIALPMLDAVLYGLLFGVLLQTSRGIENFIGFLIIGLTFFSFMSRMLKAGTGLVPTNRNLIRAFSFPRAVIVISQSLRYFWDAIPAAAIAILAALAMQFGEPISWTILLVIPLYFMICLFGTGLMFLCARITAFTPDFKVGVDLFSRAWMFSSGIFYSIERFANRPVVYEIMTWNPSHLFLEAIRNLVIHRQVPSLTDFAVLLAWSLGTFLLGFFVFWRSEDKYVWA